MTAPILPKGYVVSEAQRRGLRTGGQAGIAGAFVTVVHYYAGVDAPEVVIAAEITLLAVAFSWLHNRLRP